MLDVMQEDFVTMARMKGLSTWTVVIRHAARNALLPVTTAFALASAVSVAAAMSWSRRCSPGPASGANWSLPSRPRTIRWRRARS